MEHIENTFDIYIAGEKCKYNLKVIETFKSKKENISKDFFDKKFFKNFTINEDNTVNVNLPYNTIKRKIFETVNDVCVKGKFMISIHPDKWEDIK